MSSPELSEWGWEDLDGDVAYHEILMDEQQQELSNALHEVRTRLGKNENLYGPLSYYEIDENSKTLRVVQETVHRQQGSSYFRVLMNIEQADAYEGGELSVHEFTVDRVSDAITHDYDAESFYRCKSIQQFLNLSDIRVPYFKLVNGTMKLEVSPNYKPPEPDTILPTNLLRLFDVRNEQIEDAELLCGILGKITTITCVSAEW